MSLIRCSVNSEYKISKRTSSLFLLYWCLNISAFPVNVETMHALQGNWKGPTAQDDYEIWRIMKSKVGICALCHLMYIEIHLLVVKMQFPSRAFIKLNNIYMICLAKMWIFHSIKITLMLKVHLFSKPRFLMLNISYVRGWPAQWLGIGEREKKKCTFFFGRE